MANYESIVLELMQRIQALEKRVEQLEEKQNIFEYSNISLDVETKQDLNKSTFNNVPLSIDLSEKSESKMDVIRRFIENVFEEAKKEGKTEVILLAGEVEKAVGLKNRVAMVCNAMKEFQQKYKNEVLSTTKSGLSTTVKIKYYLD